MRRAVAVLAVALAGCGEEFRPETLVEHLRVLGINSTPAELRPGETARLGSLVLDPSRPGQATTTLWIGCDPDPFNLNRSACSDPAVLQDPSSLSGGTGELPPGVRIVGLNSQAAYSAPAGLFQALAADDPRRVTGTVGQVLAVAVAEAVSPQATQEELKALFERVQAKEVRSLIALYRIRIAESAERNTNPVLSGLRVGREAWPDGAAVTVLPSEPVTLEVDAPDASFEPYTAVLPEGTEERTERLLVAWYSTAGRFSEERTTVRGDVVTVFTAPGSAKDPVPERRTGELYTVVRDTRGGQSWRTWRLFVCDAALPEPQVAAVRWPTAAGGRVVVEGQNLDSVVDVVVNGAALPRGGFVAARGTWEADAPALAAGTYPVRVHSKTCARAGGPAVVVP